MTKYEWERQLKKGISGLPKAEQQRVLDYYNELFADKIDAGLREQYIISEFGNPYDVANKILVDYYNGDKENPEVDAYIYADSDDIDDAFDDEPAKTVETPTRKPLPDKKDERHNEHKSHHADHREQHFDDVTDETDSKKNGRNVKSASGLIVLLCVLAYCVLGACFHLWHPGWLIFLAMPCVVTLIEAIARRNWRIFAYPVFAVLVFLALGFFAHKWHPGWIVFVTIPIYYVLGDFVSKNTDDDKNANRKKSDKSKNNKTSAKSAQSDVDGEQPGKPSQTPQRVKKSNGNSNVITILAKTLMAICLVFVAIVICWWVIAIFVGGLGMIIGGIGCLAGALVVANFNGLLAGAGLAVLGLGLICAFGMAALFKPCFNMCKSFVKTIKDSFDKEVA